MKFFLAIMAAPAFIVAPALAETKDPGTICSNKAPQVVAAIGQFCTKLGDKNFVGGQFKTKSQVTKFKGKSATLSMKGGCQPKQWVPKQYCFRQFNAMCANGDKDGVKASNFGRNNCQQWYIEKGVHHRS